MGGSPLLSSLPLALQGQQVKVAHIFSCESNEKKRNLILQMETGLQHCFDNVDVFSAKRGYCYVCRTAHNIDSSTCPIDVLFCGPSCKNLSKLNADRGSYYGCYHGSDAEDTPGTSGPTYKHGFKNVSQLSCARILTVLPISFFPKQFTVGVLS